MLTKIKNGLTPNIYFELRQKASFQEYSFHDVEIALKNTLFSIVIYEDDRPIGIGRVVGDDRIVFFIKDVVVDPEFRQRSIGKLVMESLLEYIEEKACSNAYVGLMATPNTEKFYEKFGFIQRPTDTLGHGMVKFVNL
ncbi:GNAT family N-acetyltransferase [Bacillus sp. JJ1521]|uniref:GNAT family N-acetyltransferase n=1 Tax=Bacillus sp. JJ1521 TaxID=3122957 RepID=UPI003000726B